MIHFTFLWQSGCATGRICRAILTEFGIDQRHLDPEGDHCFCDQCCVRRKDQDTYERGGKIYAIPRGWYRIGLKSRFPMFDTGHVCFHGTSKDNALRIIELGYLLMPDQVTPYGSRVATRPGHYQEPFTRTNTYTGQVELFDPRQIFLSPSIRYAGCSTYTSLATSKVLGVTLRNFGQALLLNSQPINFQYPILHYDLAGTSRHGLGKDPGQSKGKLWKFVKSVHL